MGCGRCIEELATGDGSENMGSVTAHEETDIGAQSEVSVEAATDSEGSLSYSQGASAEAAPALSS